MAVKCKKCGAAGVKLWRQYGHFFRMEDLLCTACAKDEQGESASVGRHSIGWRVPYLPTEHGSAWGFTSAPQGAIDEWESTPERVG